MRALAAFFLILVAALFLRVDGLRWDDGTYPHPDERFMTMVASAIHAGKLAPSGASEAERAARRAACVARNGAPEGVGDWLDTACSDFNPANVGYPAYPYGVLPLAAVRLAAEGAEAVTRWAGFTQYGGIHLVGRLFSALCDVLTALVTFALGRLLWDRATGILAMAFYAFAVLPLQAAHFWTVDAAVVLFTAASLLFLARLARFGQRADAAAAGIAIGLALASKVSVAPLVLLVPVAAMLAPSRIPFARAPDLGMRIAVRVPDMLIAGLALFATYRIAAPYAFAGPAWYDVWPARTFIDVTRESMRLASGAVDTPPNWQWLGRMPWLDPARNLVLWGLGPALGVAAIAGAALSGLRLLRAAPRARARALPWLWAAGYFAWIGAQWVAAMRYLLPIYPVLCLFAASLLVGWRRQAGMRRAQRHRFAARVPGIVAAAALGATALWAIAFHHVHTTLHPYVAATHWLLRHAEAPISSRIVTASGEAPLINWPAAGPFGDTAAPRVAAATRAPASGTIERLHVHHLTFAARGGEVAVGMRILDERGDVLAVAPPVALAPSPTTLSGVDLPLAAPLHVAAGALYRLEVDARGGSIALSGAAIAQEGPWNDTVPARVPWLAATASSRLDGRSGEAMRGTANVDPFAEGYYVPIDLRIAGEDDAAKRERLVDGLARAEWLVVPNGRFFDAMTRDPLRFPLTTRLYDALFEGTLGYARVASITSLPSLAGVAIDDQAVPAFGRPVSGRPGLAWAAEEAFSVYDHPAVHVFRKDTGTSRATIERALGRLDLTDVRGALAAAAPTGASRLAWSTLEASAAPDGLLLPPQARGGRVARDAAMDGDGDRSPSAQLFDVVAWYAVSLLLGAIAWPWLALLWPDLAERGYGVSRIAGLALVAVPAWWLAALGLPAWSRLGLWAITLALVASTAAFAWKHRRALPLSLDVLRRAAILEAAFVALFAAGLALRLIDPDLWAPALGGEKPMDFAFFRRILVADALPPADPWFSDGRLNYYYFGWVLAGVIARMTATIPAIAYNLALPTWFAMAGVGAAALALDVMAGARACTRATWTAAGTALVAMVFLGNLDLARVLAPSIAAASRLLASGAPMSGTTLLRDSERWFWAPTRTVGERAGASFEINEFPAFTFLHGDLHAHLLALPLQLLALLASYGLAARALAGGGVRRGGGLGMAWTRIAATAIPAGLLRATNTWDWPPYLLLACASAAFVAWRAGTVEARYWHRVAPAVARMAVVAGAVAVVLTVQALVAWPFARFVTGGVTLHVFDGQRTPLLSWLAMQGWFVLAIGGWGVALVRAGRAADELALPSLRAARALRVVALAGVLTCVAFVGLVLWRGTGFVPAWPLQLALLAWLCDVLLRHARTAAERTGLLLALAGCGLALAVEWVVVGRDLGRMNTFFKLYLQSWVLLSIASAIAMGSLVGRTVPARLRVPWRVAFGVATIVSLAYLPLAIAGRAHARFAPPAPPSLDGEAFLERAVYAFGEEPLRLADDARLIRWLRHNSRIDDVVLEAQLPEYRWGSRISVFTSRPTVLGYRFHETQQRPVPTLGEAIELRRRNVSAMYASTDAERTIAALAHYRVRYVIVGGLERAAYPAPGLAKFEALAARGALQVAYRSGDDVIYRVPPATDAGSFAPAW
ncbi:MAG: DUF2298 domain-containing protein [Rudaea sp.]